MVKSKRARKVVNDLSVHAIKRSDFHKPVFQIAMSLDSHAENAQVEDLPVN